MAIKRVGLYERVSTEEQALRGGSIAAQVDALNEYCKKNKLKIVDHYTDEGISGSKPPLKRPGLKRLLDDVEAGKIDQVLFTKLDRWFRSVPEYFKVQELLERNRVEWKAIHEDYDTTTSNGRMAITIFLAIAQAEREKGSERVKAVLEHKRKNKEACFGGQAVPLGYMKQKDENGIMRLVKDPETQEAVQEFWDTLIKYNNLNKAIRLMLNKYDIAKDWKSWSYLTHSDFYMGEHRGVEDYCEPYVSKEDWLKYHESKPIKATAGGHTYLFRGLMRCPACGNKLCGDANKKNYGLYKSYRCRIRNRGCSNRHSISERKIEKYLLENLEPLLAGEIARVELEAKKPKPKPKTDVSKLKEKRRRLTVAYMAGNKTDEEYMAEDTELKALIAKAESEAPPKPRDVTPLKELMELDFQTIYAGLNEEEKQRFWSKIIKEIKVKDKQVVGVIFF